MTTSLRRFQLRERTAAAHAVVDSAIGDFDTLDSYRRYLFALYSFRAPIEAALAHDWSAILGGWRPASLTPALLGDMADLVIEAPSLPSGMRIDERQLLGTLYVLQGSSLGARLLYKRAQALGLSVTYGARHLAQQSAAIDDWRIFLDILEADDSFDIELATTASLSTFAAAASAFGARTL
jgi:heme oxygenase